METVHAGGAEIVVERGDIARMKADALVNAANNHLWMGAGVAGALKRAGGAEVEREAISKGPIEIGDAVATTAGALEAKRVIHAAVMGQDLRTSGEIIRKATASALRVASDEGLKSVALPAFGTGVGGFSKQAAAHEMVAATLEFLRRGPAGLGKIIFAVFDGEADRAFTEELQRQAGAG